MVILLDDTSGVWVRLHLLPIDRCVNSGLEIRPAFGHCEWSGLCYVYQPCPGKRRTIKHPAGMLGKPRVK